MVRNSFNSIYLFLVNYRSIQDPYLPDTILPDVPITYTLVENGSQRKNVKLVSSDEYEYTKKVSR